MLSETINSNNIVLESLGTALETQSAKEGRLPSTGIQ